jgi:hypothetical protein
MLPENERQRIASGHVSGMKEGEDFGGQVYFKELSKDELNVKQGDSQDPMPIGRM